MIGEYPPFARCFRTGLLFPTGAKCERLRIPG